MVRFVELVGHRRAFSFAGLDMPDGAKQAGQAKPGAEHDPTGVRSASSQKQKEALEKIQEVEETAGMHVSKVGRNALMGTYGYDERLADPALRWCLPASSWLSWRELMERMEDEAKDPCFEPGLGFPEQRLSSLKPHAYRAWEECKAPLGESRGSEQLRWEVFSTWMLLLCLHHVEAERERCERWKCQAWTNEAQALRHLFMRNYHLRALQAILRWLRWSHRWAPAQAERKDDLPAYTAGYERTRRAQQLRRLPSPVQACSVVHPDGPLQHSEQFQPADLEDERQLIADLWTCLRRGELSKGLKLCAESGQAWRTALLQGMMPFAEADTMSYDVMETAGPDEETEEMLSQMKEEHTDWTEIGQPKQYSHGNPWRRLWKEQCFDSAARNLQSGSSMDLCELSIYGFCSGNYDALMPYCGTFWADRCWGELHCLKEWLVERLLEDGHWCAEDPLCEIEEDADAREHRAKKLCGRLSSRLSPDIGRAVSEEVQQVLLRVLPRTSGDAYWEVPESVSEHWLEYLKPGCSITARGSELITPFAVERQKDEGSR
eukprot:symbB.v1.2.027934.t1/scaffold2904.1/size67615/4